MSFYEYIVNSLLITLNNNNYKFRLMIYCDIFDKL